MDKAQNKIRTTNINWVKMTLRSPAKKVSWIKRLRTFSTELAECCRDAVGCGGGHNAATKAKTRNLREKTFTRTAQRCGKSRLSRIYSCPSKVVNDWGLNRFIWECCWTTRRHCRLIVGKKWRFGIQLPKAKSTLPSPDRQRHDNIDFPEVVPSSIFLEKEKSSHITGNCIFKIGGLQEAETSNKVSIPSDSFQHSSAEQLDQLSVDFFISYFTRPMWSLIWQRFPDLDDEL